MAKTFGIPFRNYGGYVGRAEARPCITYAAGGISVLSGSDFSGNCAFETGLLFSKASI